MEEEKVLGFIQATVALSEERFAKRVELIEERFDKRIGLAEKRFGKRVDKAVDGLRAELLVRTADLSLEIRQVREDMAEIKKELTANLQGRREDIDAAFRDIGSLKREHRILRCRVRKLEKAKLA